MTRAEFQEGVTTWNELLDFCYDNRCDICDDVLDECSKDDWVYGKLKSMVDDCGGWEYVRDFLDDQPVGVALNDYYIVDGADRLRQLDDDDFKYYKDDVEEWAVRNDSFDDESIDDDDDDFVPYEEERKDVGESSFEVDDSLDIIGVFEASRSELQQIRAEEEDREDDHVIEYAKREIVDVEDDDYIPLGWDFAF